MGGHDTKRLLRETARTVRRRVAGDRLTRASAELCARLLAWPTFAAAERLVAYCPIDGEVDPGDVVAAAHAAGMPVYLPRTDASGMTFVAPGGPLQPGRYGIPEPRSGEVLADAGRETMILVPGVAFDLAGTRLGRGGGHYDRALSVWPSATTVGLAYEFQILPSLPRDPWDVPVSAIFTDARSIVPAAPAAVGRT